jgi:hypothetical protein
MIKLRGLFEISLGGFSCIRGYAKFGDLAKVSKPNPGYQRDLLHAHSEEIVKFLSDQTYLFFPEVILSYTLQYDFNKKGAISGLKPIVDIKDKNGFKSNVDKTAIAFNKSNGLATITIDENIKPLNRVDGNHRLSAVSLNKEFEYYIAPFCIIILPDEKSGSQKDKVIFHNINFKAVPLDEEDSLKIILEDKNLFADSDLKSDSFGWEYFLTREIIGHISEFKNVSVVESNEKYRTLIKNIAKILLDEEIIEKNDKSTEIILASLKEIDLICKSKTNLGKNPGVFSALVIINIDKPKFVDSFIKWIEDSNIYNIKEISTTSLLDIFRNRIEAKSRDIFISLKIKNKESEKNFEAIKSVIEKINKGYFSLDRKLKLIPIRVDKSDYPYTFQITDAIIKRIEECGLFIADLTGKNPNVYNESGYAMGYIKGKNLDNKIIFILHHKRNIKNVDKKVAFNLRNYSQVRFSDRRKLKKELQKKITDCYGL